MDVHEYAARAVPLSLVMFKGADLVSNTIRVLEGIHNGRNEYSHMGIVVTAECCPFLPSLRHGHAYVWESTFSHRILGFGDGVPDVTTGHTAFGVQIRDLCELVPAYTRVPGTAVAVANLLDNPWLAVPDETQEQLQTRRAHIVKTLERMFHKYCTKTYELNLLQLLAAVIPCLRPARDFMETTVIDGINALTNLDLVDDTTRYVFCSEFVALLFQALDIIPPRFKAHEVLPTDFFGQDRDGLPQLAYEATLLTCGDNQNIKAEAEAEMDIVTN